MTTGRSETRKPTIVWCITITNDFTIISGDSRGKLTFWDGKIGAQIESYQSHRADILALCLNDDQTSLFCSGIDPNIVNYVKITVKDGTHKWVKSLQRKIHEHDIRALVLNDNKLYSSGVDGYLACSHLSPKKLFKYPPILQNPITLASKARLIMLRYHQHIEIWSLGMPSNEKDKNTGLLLLDQEPKKLVLLQKLVKGEEGENDKEGIISSTMSDDGQFVMYSTRFGNRIFKLIIVDNKPELIPLEVCNEVESVPCLNSVFVSQDRLIMAMSGGGLKLVGFANDSPYLIQDINTQSGNIF